MSPDDLFGWELLIKTIEQNIKTEADIIIVLAHWILIRTLSLLCIGIGDDKTLADDEIGQETLPDGWNENGDTYALRYTRNGKLYMLMATKTEDHVVLNLMDPKSNKVSNLTIDPKETIKARKGNIKTMIPDIDRIIERFRKELIEPVFVLNVKEVTTQTPEEQRSSSPLFEGWNQYDIPIRRPPPSYDPLRDVGAGDLNPFGRGGGMLFPDPGQERWLPRPQFPGIRPPPPGARFDPIAPDVQIPGPRPRGPNRNPNPDHFRPPPDFDDMYL